MSLDGYDVAKPSMFQGGNIIPDSIFRWFLACIPFKFSTFILVNTTVILINTLVMFSVKAWNKWKHGKEHQKNNNTDRKLKSRTTSLTTDYRPTDRSHKIDGWATKGVRRLISRKHFKGQDIRKLNRMKIERDEIDHESVHGGGATLDEITWLSSTDESACYTCLPQAGHVTSKSRLNIGCKQQKTFRSMPPDYKFGTIEVNETPVEYCQHITPRPVIKPIGILPDKRKEKKIQFNSTINPNECYPLQRQKNPKVRRKKVKKHFRRLSKHNRSPHRSKTRLIYLESQEKFNGLRYSSSQTPHKSQNDNVDLASSLTSVWSNSLVEPNKGKRQSPSSDSQIKSNKSELSTNLNRDSWIWFSPISQAGAEDFTTRQNKFRSTDPRVPQLIEEINRQDQMNKDILREANSLVEAIPSKIPFESIDKNERFDSVKQVTTTTQKRNHKQSNLLKPVTLSQSKRNLPRVVEKLSPKRHTQTKERNSPATLNVNSTRSSQVLSVPNIQPQNETTKHELIRSKSNEVKPSHVVSKVTNTITTTPTADKPNPRRNQQRFNQSKVVHEVRSTPEKNRGEGISKGPLDTDPFRSTNNSPRVSHPHGDGQHASTLATTSKPIPLSDITKMKFDFPFQNSRPLKTQSPVKEFSNVSRKPVYRTKSDFDLRDSYRSQLLTSPSSNHKVKPSVSCVFNPYSNKTSPEKCRKVSPVRIVNCIQHEAPIEIYSPGTKYVHSPKDLINITGDKTLKPINGDTDSLSIYLNRTPVVHTKEESESDSFFVQSSSLDNSTLKGTTQIGQEVSRTIKDVIFNNDSNSSVSTHNKIQPEQNRNNTVSPAISPSAMAINANQVSFTNTQPIQKSPNFKPEPESRNFNNKQRSPSTSPTKKQNNKSVFSSSYYLGKRAHSNLKKYGINKKHA